MVQALKLFFNRSDDLMGRSGVRQFEILWVGATPPHKLALASRTGISDGLWCHAQGTEPGERSRGRASPRSWTTTMLGIPLPGLFSFDRYFSREVKQAGAAAARAPHENGAD